VRLRAALSIAVATAVTVLVFSSTAHAAPAGTWRCSAQGNIPIGVLKITSGGYTFQAVRDTVWSPKPGDPSNGSGSLTVKGSKVSVSSGPLRKHMKVTTGVYGGAGNDEYIDLYNNPNSVYLLRCLRP